MSYDSQIVTRKVCGHCGAYRRLHPVDHCKGFRVSWWWDRHSLIDHVGTWLWIHALTSRARWAVAKYLCDRGSDWCGLVDSVMTADGWQDEQVSYGISRGYKHDYSGEWGCLCDFPAPWRVGPVVPGRCYCPTPEERQS